MASTLDIPRVKGEWAPKDPQLKAIHIKPAPKRINDLYDIFCDLYPELGKRVKLWNKIVWGADERSISLVLDRGSWVVFRLTRPDKETGWITNPFVHSTPALSRKNVRINASSYAGIVKGFADSHPDLADLPIDYQKGCWMHTVRAVVFHTDAGDMEFTIRKSGDDPRWHPLILRMYAKQ